MNLLHDATKTGLARLLAAADRQKRPVVNDILDFYLRTFPEVYLVSCNGCGAKLILEYADPQRPNPAHSCGRQLVELSRKYLSHRKRLDGIEGYQCACGNDNRWAYIEWEATKSDGREIAPHHEAVIAAHIAATNYSPAVTVKGKDLVIEDRFTVRKLK